MTPQVTLGRIVHFFDGKDANPALVVHVNEDLTTVNLVYWNRFGVQHTGTDIKLSLKPATEAKTWYWPPMATPAQMKQFADAFFGKKGAPNTHSTEPDPAFAGKTKEP